MYPGGAGLADLDLAGPAGSPHPTGPAVCQPRLVADLGRVPSPLLVSFSVNMGRLIIINVKRFPSDGIVLKILEDNECEGQSSIANKLVTGFSCQGLASGPGEIAIIKLAIRGLTMFAEHLLCARRVPGTEK